jgi:tight adherence protein C
MNATFAIAVLWFICGTGCAALVERLVRSGSASPPLADSHIQWPIALRPFLGAARILSGAMGHRMPAGQIARVRRRLEKADLYPGVDAGHWMALCICVATSGGVIASAAAAVAKIQWLLPALIASAACWIACERWLRRRIANCERRIIRDLPSYLDLFTICVEAGATLTAAARFIVEQAPEGPLRNYFDRVLREIRSGRSRAQAFVSVADAYGVECLCTLASTLSHAEAAGMSVGQVLRTQAEQRSAERFVRAERQAMQAPVKMLGPLIFCIFPCTFIVLAVPIAHRLMEAFQT